MERKKITVRVTEAEYNTISKRAKDSNLSINQFLVESALRPAPRNDRQLSNLMGQLCRLEVCVQKANTLETLKRDVLDWRQMTMHMMEG